MNRFASIIRSSLENQNYANRRSIFNNRNNNINININNDVISFNSNKMKILILIVITIIMSLSNYFYSINNRIYLIHDEPKIILSLFENQIIKKNSPSNFNQKEKLRRLIQESNNKTEEDNKKLKSKNHNNINIKDIFENYMNISNLIYNISKNNNDYEIKINGQQRIPFFIYNNIKRQILVDLTKNIYKLKWKSIKYGNNSNIYNIGDSFQGEGIFNFKKETEFFTGQEFMLITMKNNEDKFIDNWIFHSSISSLDALYINKNNNNKTFEIKGVFLTRLYKGEYFNILNEESPDFCETNVKIEFPLDDQIFLNNNSIYINNLFDYETIKLNQNNFSLIMESSCGFKFIIKAQIFQKETEDKILNKKINVYFIMSIISSLLYIIGIYSVIFGVKKYESTLSVISNYSFAINPIWNTYILLANINLFMKMNINYNIFCVVVFLLAIKFLFFDFRLLTIYWKKRRSEMNARIFLKEKIIFYLLYYLFLFCSFLFINSFFINYIYIMIICILLWIPQIIHNIKSNNKYGYPLIYILSSTIDKLIYPLYFRGIKNNFLGTKDNFILILIMIIFVLLTIIVMYMQTLKGPGFMLSISSNQLKYDFYKDKNELITIRNNIGSEECVICLLPIFEFEKEIMIEMEDKTEIKNEEDKVENSNNNIKIDINDMKDENNLLNNDTCDSSNFIINSNEGRLENKEVENGNENDVQQFLFISNDNKDKNIENYIKVNVKEEDEIFLNSTRNQGKELLIYLYIKSKSLFKEMLYLLKILFCQNFFSFYKKTLNSLGKSYMYTPCNHVFHTECLEQWLEYKKECPSCRKSLGEYL